MHQTKEPCNIPKLPLHLPGTSYLLLVQISSSQWVAASSSNRNLVKMQIIKLPLRLAESELLEVEAATLEIRTTLLIPRLLCFNDREARKHAKNQRILNDYTVSSLALSQVWPKWRPPGYFFKLGVFLWDEVDNEQGSLQLKKSTF